MWLHSPRKTGAWRRRRPLWYNLIHMKRFAYLLAALLAASVAAASTGDVIRTAAELQAAAFDRAEVGRLFDIEVRLVMPCHAGDEATFAVDDESGAVLVRKDVSSRPETASWASERFAAGTRARIAGVIGLGQRSRRAYPYCSTITPLGKGPAPKPKRISPKEFLSGEYDCRLVVVNATVRDIVTDEINPDYKYVILDMEGEIVPMPVNAGNPLLESLAIGSKIEVTGVCTPTQLGIRRQLGRHIILNRILTISDTQDNPYDAPLLEDFTRLRPQDIAALGRHRAVGHVIASWHGDSALIKSDDGKMLRIETDAGSAPGYGEMSEDV